MKFYNLSQVPTRSDDRVFKVSPVGSAVGLAVSLGIAIALFMLGFHGGVHQGNNGLNLPPLLAYLIGASFGVLPGLICFGSLRAALKPTNWLLRCNNTGLIIKYRSYLNWRLPAEDIQAVGFDYAEIAWARKAKEWRDSPGLGGEKRREFMTYLDLCLANADTALLEARLQAERARKWTFLVLIYPVDLLPGGILRLRWREGGGGLYSNAGKAVQWLGRHIKIADEVSAKTNLTRQPNPAPGEEDAKILAVVKSGDKIGAVNLTRQVYGCSLTEAVEFVEKLQCGKKIGNKDRMQIEGSENMPK